MSNDRLRVVRDEISKGDDVCITRRGNRPRKARVIDVMRAAVRVRYDDTRREELVMFSDVKRYEDDGGIVPIDAPPPAAPVAAAPERRGPGRPRKQTLPTLAPMPPMAAPQPPPSEPADTSDVRAWLDMGREMVAKLREDVTALENQERALRADAKQLTEEADAVRKRAQEQAQRLAAVRSVVGAP